MSDFFGEGIYTSPDVSFGYEADFYQDNVVRLKVNKQISVSPFVHLRTSYADVEEIVDDSYFVPSSAAVTSKSKSYKGLYDSPESLKDPRVARLNASIRHPAADPVEVNSRLEQLKRITVEFVDGDKTAVEKAAEEKAAAEKAAAEKTAADSVIPPVSYQPPK